MALLDAPIAAILQKRILCLHAPPSYADGSGRKLCGNIRFVILGGWRFTNVRDTAATSTSAWVEHVTIAGASSTAHLDCDAALILHI